jgi:hypothetical protein
MAAVSQGKIAEHKLLLYVAVALQKLRQVQV